MVIGLMMVKATPGQERQVYRSLKETDGVTRVYHIFGEYDFFVVAEAGSLPDIKKLVYGLKEIYDVTGTRAIVSGNESNFRWAEAC